MKIIITESQFTNIFIKRRYDRIEQLVDEKMRYYPPCDYTYDPRRAFFDYLDDITNGVIHEMLSDDLNIEWTEGNINKIDDFSETMTSVISRLFMDKIRDFYDMVISEGCDEDY